MEHRIGVPRPTVSYLLLASMRGFALVGVLDRGDEFLLGHGRPTRHAELRGDIVKVLLKSLPWSLVVSFFQQSPCTTSRQGLKMRNISSLFAIILSLISFLCLFVPFG